MTAVFLSSVSASSRSSGGLHFHVQASLFTLSSGLENLKCLFLLCLFQNICLGQTSRFGSSLNCVSADCKADAFTLKRELQSCPPPVSRLCPMELKSKYWSSLHGPYHFLKNQSLHVQGHLNWFYSFVLFCFPKDSALGSKFSGEANSLPWKHIPLMSHGAWY